jgi:hypothetical protein
VVARNAGARFSEAGFRLLLKRSSGDDALAVQVGTRRDLPRQHFLALLEQASATVRTRLAAENPTAATTVEGVLTEVVGGIRSETRKISSQYAAAAAEVGRLKQDGRLGEAEVYKFARENRFEEATVALSMLCSVELDAVERALQDRGHEIALILAKLAGFSSTTAKAILLLKTADRGISAQDLDNALRTYEKLQLETARRVLGFYRTRLKTRGNSSALAGGGLVPPKVTAGTRPATRIIPLDVPRIARALVAHSRRSGHALLERVVGAVECAAVLTEGRAPGRAAVDRLSGRNAGNYRRAGKQHTCQNAVTGAKQTTHGRHGLPRGGERL